MNVWQVQRSRGNNHHLLINTLYDRPNSCDLIVCHISVCLDDPGQNNVSFLISFGIFPSLCKRGIFLQRYQSCTCIMKHKEWKSYDWLYCIHHYMWGGGGISTRQHFILSLNGLPYWNENSFGDAIYFQSITVEGHLFHVFPWLICWPPGQNQWTVSYGS